ncbi:hypothetical protein NMY22_g3557 [Coprinellus aureogranulatus]|nr:hypothetical protein NMY22_g3557 [Coprinellus aureogranulatus]
MLKIYLRKEKVIEEHWFTCVQRRQRFDKYNQCPGREGKEIADHPQHPLCTLSPNVQTDMGELPLEIQARILKMLSDDGEDYDAPGQAPSIMDPLLTEGKQALAMNCTRVSTAFYIISMPLVWKEIVVRSGSDVDHFLQVTSVDLVRKLRNDLQWYTERIDIRLGSGYNTNKVVELLKRLSNLQELNISNHGFLPRRNSGGRYSNGLLIEVAVQCTKLVKLQLTSMPEKPTVREISLISKSCPVLETLQAYEIDMKKTTALDVSPRSHELADIKSDSAPQALRLNVGPARAQLLPAQLYLGQLSFL